MSGFSADWLALREPADHRARDRALMADLGSCFAGRSGLKIADLGCGTGSNLRALAPFLPMRQSWRLIDHDPALLAAARGEIAAWADRVDAEDATEIVIVKADRGLTVSFHEADLARDPGAALPETVDLVTAAALFDLVSAAWIARFADALARRRAVFYTALTYTGEATWSPPHPADAAIVAAFNRHQKGDKGFGPSEGPAASDRLSESLQAKGYRVATADSPWRLDPATEKALIAELAAGIAEAAVAAGEVSGALAADWLSSRKTGAACEIGHADLLAFPAG